jgi:ATP-binding cassette subfamily F protein 3
VSLVTLSSVSKHFGAEEVLDDVSFRIERGDHASLVGTNGAGKSTLLRIIAGLESADSGTVSRASGARIVYLEQEPDFRAAETVYDAMLDVFRETIAAQERLRVLEREMAASHDEATVEEYGRLQALVEHAGYNYRDQIERVLEGLELGPDTWHQPIENLSGGQRTRANLARTLLQDADLLLLDEPTNHLDITAVEWLERYLRDLKRAFLIVAHDRYLLDRVTRRTVELSFHHITTYDAPYGRYLQIKAERLERQRDEYEAQQRHIARTEEYIRRYGAGQRAREARGREKRLNRLERIERPREEASVHLRLKKARRTGDVALELRNLVAGYLDNPLVRLPEEVVIRRGERVALIGPNGSGKSTLLRTLIGELEPLGGSVRWGANTALGYYSQTLEGLDERLTVLEQVQTARAMSEEEARSYLGRFLFTQDDAFKTVGILSGGEKSRVALARLILDEPNVLVLDEPTNHLDIVSRDALQDVLSAFEGTLIFVSHDRYLIDALAQQIWALEEGRMTRYDGNYSAYAEGRAPRLDRPDAPMPARAPRTATSPEEELIELQQEAADLSAQIAEQGSTASVARLSEMLNRFAETEARLQEAQQAWLRQIREQVRASSG